MTIRVLVADDHPVFRDGLRFTLSQASDVVVAGEAADGEQAVSAAEESAYDVVVMDVRMPRLDGVAATPRVTATGARVLVLTMFEDDATVLAALRAGASGYLVKGADADQVVSAVRAVADGHAVLGPSLAGRMLEHFGGSSLRAPASPAPRGAAPGLPDLSAREAEVLALVSDGLTNIEIGERLFISPITVRNHVSRILEKLQVRDRREAMLRVHEARATTHALGSGQPSREDG